MATLAKLDWADPLDLDSQLTEEERMIRDTAAGYCQRSLMPRVQRAFRGEHFDREIMRELGALGLTSLIGTPVLKAYMHGFFMDARLHGKVLAAIAKAKDSADNRKDQMKQKIQMKIPKLMDQVGNFSQEVFREELLDINQPFYETLA
jgi:hypothetical protein